MGNPSLSTVENDTFCWKVQNFLVKGNERHIKQNLNRANFEMSQSWKAFGRKYA